MNAQAAELNTIVGDLLVMVGGRRLHDPEGKAGAPLPGGRRPIDPGTHHRHSPAHAKAALAHA
jgi:hypothetical protein